VSKVLCPSAQADGDIGIIIGVVGRHDGNSRVALLPEAVPLQSVAHLIPDTIPATEVLRLATPCAEMNCAHFSNQRCTLISRIIDGLPAVADRLSRCAIRPSCRWWRQAGAAACLRCPQIVTEPFQASDIMREIATPAPSYQE